MFTLIEDIKWKSHRLNPIKDLDILVASIHDDGMFNPIVLEALWDSNIDQYVGFVIVEGVRRYLAVQKLGYAGLYLTQDKEKKEIFTARLKP